MGADASVDVSKPHDINLCMNIIQLCTFFFRYIVLFVICGCGHRLSRILIDLCPSYNINLCEVIPIATRAENGSIYNIYSIHYTRTEQV